MNQARLASRSLLGAVIVMVLVLGGKAPTLSAARSAGTWHNLRALFPSVSVYPKGTHLLPLYTSTNATDVVGPNTALQVDRFRFVVGGVQDANLPAQAVVSVTVLAFTNARVAAAFLHVYHPTELQYPAAPGTRVSRFGAGARYIVGGCANCGPTGPALGIMLLPRGANTVEIVTQPPNHTLVMRLADVISRAGVRTS